MSVLLITKSMLPRRMLLPYVEYALRALLRLEKLGQTDGQTTDRYITLTAARGQRYKNIDLFEQLLHFFLSLSALLIVCLSSFMAE